MLKLIFCNFRRWPSLCSADEEEDGAEGGDGEKKNDRREADEAS